MLTCLIIVSFRGPSTAIHQMTTNKKQYDVAVIGAGVFGAWCAHFLNEAGLSVLLVDAYGPGNSRSSSGGESRIIRIGYGSDEIYSRWAVRSLEFWHELSTGSQPSLFVPTGMLWMAREGHPQTLATASTLTSLGIRFEQLDRTELERRFPQIEFGPITWAIFEPESGALLARRAVQSLVTRATNNGVDYKQMAVIPPVKDKHRIDEVLTGAGEPISAGTFIFACGPWLPQLFPALLGEVIHATRQEVYFFGVPAGDSRFGIPAMPAWIDFQSEFYGLPDIENRGFKIALDRHGPLTNPDTEERLPTRETFELVRGHLAERFPAMKDAPLVETRICQYENTPNGDFLIDRHPEIENVWLVGGGSGHGFKHGPAVGEFVTSLLTGDQSLEPRFLLSAKKMVRKRAIY